jgi:hypothetical protein
MNTREVISVPKIIGERANEYRLLYYVKSGGVYSGAC